MVNFGFKVNTAAIGQAGNASAGPGLVQKTNDVSDANAGFFGMLLALVSRPINTNLPVMPDIGTGRAGTEQETPVPDASAAPPSMILSGTATAAPAGGSSGSAEPVIEGDPVIAQSPSPDAGPETSVLRGDDSDEIDALLTQLKGRQLKALQNTFTWSEDLRPAAKSEVGDTSIWSLPRMAGEPEQSNPAPMEWQGNRVQTSLWNLPRTAGEPEQSNPAPMERQGNRAQEALNTEARATSAPANRISSFFANELFRVSEPAGETIHSQTLDAFSRMAQSGNPPRPAAPTTDAGQVATVIPGQAVVSTEEANGVSLTAARGEAVLESLIKMATDRRVEPVVTREDVEDAFIFGAPQDTALTGGKSAPADEVWARAVVSRVTDETVDARAAGKTSVSFDITTESGEIVRVRVAMRNNVVSGRIGVMDSETKEILALHIPELNQRLQTENLIPERFDVYVMNGEGHGGRRGQQRRPKWTAEPSDGHKTEDDFIYVTSEPKTFEKWA
jgi:hypothetical protein